MTRCVPLSFDRFASARPLEGRGRLGYALAILAISLLLIGVVEHAKVAACAVAGVIVVGCVWPAVLVRLVSAKAVAPTSRLTVGQSGAITLRLRNRLPLPLPGFELLLPAGIGASQGLVIAGRQTSVEVGIVARRRGEHDLGRAQLTTCFPFGLWRSCAPVRSDCRLLVWPRPLAVPSLSLEPLAGEATAEASAYTPNHDGEFVGLRPYRRGDSIRGVHWQQTARQNRLIVRERAGGERRTLRVMLDTSTAAYAAPDEFERAVSVVAHIVEHAVEQRVTLVLSIGNHRVVVQGPTDRVAIHDALARVEMAGGESLNPLAGTLVVTTTSGAGRMRLAGRCVPLCVDQLQPEPTVDLV